ncbi:MAG: OmpA family protein [Bacteroidetes bacterium]|nr:OmpA family protein [Bacteroidota bacterium]
MKNESLPLPSQREGERIERELRSQPSIVLWKGFKTGFVLLTLLMLCAGNITIAQKYLAKGNKYFDRNMFKEAIANYQLELDKGKGKNKDTALQQIADCYRLTGQFELAEDAYKKISKKKKNAKNILNYALSLKGSSKYAEASEQFKEYIKLNPGDPMGKVYMHSCDSAQKWLDENMAEARYEVKNIEQVNTPGSEFSPAFYKDGIAFCSSRKDSKKALMSFNGGDEVIRLDLYYEPLNYPPANLPLPENMKDLNSPLHEGPAAFTRDGNEVYFTRTIRGKREKNKKAIISTLQILYSQKDSTGKWSKPKSAFEFNSSQYSVAHPSLTKNGKYLYFMSDMPGGQGGTDIYYVEKNKDGSWGKPVNLGPEVNTFGHEMYPFIATDNTLYFSSDVHPGMGKLDIFSARYDFDEDKWKHVTNMQPPINSIGDDFSFILSDENDMGFFSSDRFNGKGAEDIYGFIEMRPMTLSINGSFFEFKDNSLLDGITYKIINNETNEENVLISQNGKYSFQITEGKTFTLSSRKEGFSYNKVELSLTRNTDKEYIQAYILPKQRGISVNGILLESTDKDSTAEKKQIPITNISVSLLDYSNAASVSNSKTNNNGFYSFNAKLFPGKKYLITAKKQAVATKQQSKTATLPKKETLKQMKVDTLNKVQVIGTVRGRKGIVPNAKISISDTLGMIKKITSNANGQYNLNVIASQKYHFSVSEKGFLPKEIEVFSDQRNKQIIKDIDLSEIVIDTIIKLDDVYYDYNSAVIQTSSLPSLNKLITFMEANSGVVIELSSHTDSRGDDEYNLKLSQARAQMVKDYLVLFDINASRIFAKGYGETKPVVKNAQAEAEHQKNRRTEFKILKK